MTGPLRANAPALVLACLATIRLAGCRCGEPESLAELLELAGRVERDFAERLHAWQPAKAQDRFVLGDGIRARAASSAVLKLSDGTFVHLAEQTEIRFLTSTVPGAEVTGIDVVAGEAEIVVGPAEIQLATGVGIAAIAPGSRFKIRKIREGVELRVDIGRATFQPIGEPGAGESILEAGQSVKVAIGGAILSPVEEAVDLGVISPSTDDTGAETDIESDTTTESDTGFQTETAIGTDALAGMHVPADETGPRYADFFTRAGESSFAYAAKPPVVVELQFSRQCRYGGVVRLLRNKTRVRGRLSANLSLYPGRNPYRVHCLGEDGTEGSEVAAKGVITVIRSTGQAPLPRSAPPSVVDADGRRYKISYQNQLPEITFRWPNAPQADTYVLHFESGRQIRTSRPEHVFATGTLKEGVHRLKFTVLDLGGRSSKTTEIRLQFDNVTPKTSLKEPQEGTFGAGDRVKVEGVAARGWKASVIGGDIFSDNQNRFSGEFVYNGKYRAVALRLIHPKRGIHYYLRRSRQRAEQ